MESIVKYLSPEWREQAEALIRRDITPEDMKNSTVTMANEYLNCPDGTVKYLFIKFTDGVLDKFEIGEGTAPEADFKVIADYEVYVKIAKEELTGQSAVMSGKMRIKGNIMTAMKHAAAREKTSKLIAAIPTDY